MKLLEECKGSKLHNQLALIKWKLGDNNAFVKSYYATEPILSCQSIPTN